MGLAITFTKDFAEIPRAGTGSGEKAVHFFLTGVVGLKDREQEVHNTHLRKGRKGIWQFKLSIKY